MNSLLLHDSTKLQLGYILKSPPHALLLKGRAGSGKATIARALSVHLLDSSNERLNIHPYYRCIDPDEPAISIDTVRELQGFLKLKVSGAANSPVQRIVTIVRAERLRTEAQNALLKTLEEPPAGTMLILTSDNPEALLPTITSRAQAISVLPVDEQQAKAYFRPNDPAEFKRSYALSGGQAGLLRALVEGDGTHPLIEDVATAKTLLAKTLPERLQQVDQLARDKQQVERLLDAFLRLTHAGLHAASTKHTSSAVRAWHTRQAAVLASMEYLRKNTNTKLVLDNLFLQI